MESKSQAGQDLWVQNILKNKNNGFFMDIGANDGISFNNSYLLEKEFSWTGICIEADPTYNELLHSNRNCNIINTAISNYNGVGKFNIGGMGGKLSNEGVDVNVITFKELFKNNSFIPKVIDYISLDIEGNEYNALMEFPFDEYKFICLTVEHNIYTGELKCYEQKQKIYDLLSKNNYIRVVDDMEYEGNAFEDWYVLKEYLK